MSFLLPAVPLSFPKIIVGDSGIAANIDGSLMAFVDSSQNCVFICSVDSAGDCTAEPIVVRGGQFWFPISACFVRRGGADSLLITDGGSAQVVEATTGGKIMRAIPCDSFVTHVAYCGETDVIAVAGRHKVVLLQYETEKVLATIGTGFKGPADDQLNFPQSVAFTADGECIVVADEGNHRVSKFSAVTGAFISHVVSSGITFPIDVLPCDDGSLLVAQGRFTEYASIVRVKDGVIVEKVVCGNAPVSLCSSQVCGGVIVKCKDRSVYLLRDAWLHGSRCAWLSATCVK